MPDTRHKFYSKGGSCPTELKRKYVAPPVVPQPMSLIEISSSSGSGQNCCLHQQRHHSQQHLDQQQQQFVDDSDAAEALTKTQSSPTANNNFMLLLSRRQQQQPHNGNDDSAVPLTTTATTIRHNGRLEKYPTSQLEAPLNRGTCVSTCCTTKLADQKQTQQLTGNNQTNKTNSNSNICINNNGMSVAQSLSTATGERQLAASTRAQAEWATTGAEVAPSARPLSTDDAAVNDNDDGDRSAAQKQKSLVDRLAKLCPFIGIILTLLASMSSVMGSTTIKLQDSLLGLEFTFYRCQFVFLYMFLFIFISGKLYKWQNLSSWPTVVDKFAPNNGERTLYVLRSLVYAMGIGSYYHAVMIVPLPDYTTLRFTQAMFTLIIARIYLAEPCSLNKIVALVMSMVGVIFITRPDTILQLLGYNQTLSMGDHQLKPLGSGQSNNSIDTFNNSGLLLNSNYFDQSHQHSDHSTMTPIAGNLSLVEALNDEPIIAGNYLKLLDDTGHHHSLLIDSNNSTNVGAANTTNTTDATGDWNYKQNNGRGSLREKIAQIMQTRLFGDMSVLFGSLCCSMSWVLTKSCKSTPTTVMMFWFSVFLGALSCLLMSSTSSIRFPDSWWVVLMILGNVVATMLAQALIIFALKFEDSGVVTLLRTFDIVGAFFINIVVLHETIATTSIVGSVLIGASVILVVIDKMVASKKTSKASCFLMGILGSNCCCSRTTDYNKQQSKQVNS